MRVVQSQKENDFASRRNFRERFLAMIAENESIICGWLTRNISSFLDMLKNIILGTEVTPISINSIRNLFLLPRKRLAVRFLRQIHFEKKRERGEGFTVNIHRYVEMLRTLFNPRLSQYEVNDQTLCQQDGATSHTVTASVIVLNG